MCYNIYEIRIVLIPRNPLAPTSGFFCYNGNH
nr:MAG TPA: Coproporphyrinogen III oxidase [Caudoviricetes sp.]